MWRSSLEVVLGLNILPMTAASLGMKHPTWCGACLVKYHLLHKSNMKEEMLTCEHRYAEAINMENDTSHIIKRLK
jgi:hypothetical protein